MHLKDYYKILELEPSATLPEIKKAYRRLAQQYHPDKNTTEPYALTYFTAIKEAYEVLTDPSKKDYYLQQRWYQQSLGKKKFSHQPVTPPVVLNQVLELDKYVSTLDIFRMDKPGLLQYIRDILSDDTIEQLKQFNEPGVNTEIARSVMRIAKNLNYPQIEESAMQLKKLCSGQDSTIEEINIFLQTQKRKNYFESYKFVIIVVATLFISLLIYFVSR